MITLEELSWKSPASRLFTQPFIRVHMKVKSNLRVTGLCVGNSPVTGEFPAQMASNAENVSIWWRHHALGTFTAFTPLPSLMPAVTWGWCCWKFKKSQQNVLMHSSLTAVKLEYESHFQTVKHANGEIWRCNVDLTPTLHILRLKNFQCDYSKWEHGLFNCPDANHMIGPRSCVYIAYTTNLYWDKPLSQPMREYCWVDPQEQT